MAKVLRREVTLVDDRDEDHVEKLRRGEPGVQPLPQVVLQPGDEVPSWAEEYIEDSWCEDPMDAAGSNLYDDAVYQVVKGVADEREVEYGDDWDASQIAAAVKAAEFREQVATDLDLDEDEEAEAFDEGKQAMADLFNDSNKAGNVNAPDQAAPKPASRARKSTSGAQSEST